MAAAVIFRVLEQIAAFVSLFGFALLITFFLRMAYTSCLKAVIRRLEDS